MKNVLIIGGSRGIGAACVRRFSRSGDRVVFTYNHSGGCAAALRDECGADFVRCDVRSATDVDDAVRRALEMLGSIDVLVANAGVAHFDLLQHTSDDDLCRVIDTDLVGVFRACRAVAPSMISQKNGRIVTVASMWGEVGSSCESAYSAAKGGVIALTKALAKELAPSGITVNCVSPGVIATEMNAALTEETLAALAEETPLGRIGTADEVAAAISFLASDDASFITGQVLGVNGGLVI